MNMRPILSALLRHKITGGLLILEIALTFAIVSNAVFLISQRLDRMHLASGIAEHELVQIRTGDIGNRPDAKAQAETTIAVLRQVAGVEQVALINQLPFSFGGLSSSGVMLDPQQQQPTAQVTTYYGQNVMSTLGVQLVAGRDFQPGEYVDLDKVMTALQTGDTKGLPQTVIVTRTLAERLWPGQSVLGKVLYLSKDMPFRVVGVVASLARPDKLEDGPEYSTLWPIHVTPAEGASYLLRSAPQDRDQVLSTALRKLKELDPNRVVLVTRTYDEARQEFFARDRAMVGTLSGVIAALLIVTALGIAGLASFWVGQRRRSIGVRRALGATRADILRYFLTENFLISSGGVIIGLGLAISMNTYMMSHFAVSRLSTLYLLVGIVTLILLGQAATLGPALRAARVSPAEATRSR